MELRKLGRTDLKVSSICLGTMTWGEQNAQSEAHEQLDYAFERGVNFIDTAEMYPVPPIANTYSKTEQIIGNWDKLKSAREKIILATKIAGPSEMMTYIRNGSRFNKEQIHSAVNNSLQRLGTDYIDLYQLHWPDRSTNCFGQRNYNHNQKEISTPIEETLEVLNDIQKSGKVRYFGLSNETPWGTMEFLRIANEKNWPRMVSVQNPYNLLNRTYETGMAEVSHREDIGLLAYSPMAFGALSGKYRNGAKPKNGRLTLWNRFDRYSSKNSVDAIEKYCQLAEKLGTTPAKLSVQFVTSRPFVTSNIIGATKIEQLKENLDSVEVKIDVEVLKEIDKIHEEITNPAP